MSRINENAADQNRKDAMHKEIVPPIPVHNPFKCHLCGYSFHKRKQCLDHYQTEHPQEYLQLQDLIEDERNPDTNDNSGKSGAICAFCMRHLKKSYYIREHMHTHLKNQSFECQYCGKPFSWKNSLNQHMKRVHGPINKWKCESCNKHFSSKGNMDRHMKQFHDPSSSSLNKWKCESCNKNFSWKSGMQQHMKEIHGPLSRSLNEWKCESCNKHFSRKSNMDRHMRRIHDSLPLP